MTDSTIKIFGGDSVTDIIKLWDDGFENAAVAKAVELSTAQLVRLGAELTMRNGYPEAKVFVAYLRGGSHEQ